MYERDRLAGRTHVTSCSFEEKQKFAMSESFEFLYVHLRVFRSGNRRLFDTLNALRSKEGEGETKSQTSVLVCQKRNVRRRTKPQLAPNPK